MTADDDGPQRRRRLTTGRLEAFSDGVFAIAVTLLILDVAVPADSGGNLLGAVGDQWASYLAYLVSFSTIGAVWLAHSVITEYLDRADAVFVRLNLLLLLVVSFLPFPTRLLAEYVGRAVPSGWRSPSTGSTSFSLPSWCQSCGAMPSGSICCDPMRTTTRSRC